MTGYDKIKTKTSIKERILIALGWAVFYAIIFALLAGFTLWVIAA